MDVWTLQLANPKTQRLSRAHEMALTQGIEVLDTTRGTGLEAFAPDWKMVMGVKSGSMTPEEYTVLYKKMMQDSYTYHFASKWLEVANKPKVALACYCKPGVFCHRHLLKGYFQGLCGKLGLGFVDHGELTPIVPSRSPHETDKDWD